MLERAAEFAPTLSTVGRTIVIVVVLVVCGSQRGRQSHSWATWWEARVSETKKEA